MSRIVKTGRLLLGAAVGLALTSAPCTPSSADERADRTMQALHDKPLDDDLPKPIVEVSIQPTGR
jgi:hypothetical protein